MITCSTQMDIHEQTYTMMIISQARLGLTPKVDYRPNLDILFQKQAFAYEILQSYV